MIGVIVVMTVCITIGIMSILQMNRETKRIKELEDILNRYYEQREKTLKLRLKDKGLIE
jgi:hypothetical protein